MFTVLQTEEFVAWLDDFKDKRAQVRIAAQLRQAESGNLGDCSPWRAQSRNCGSTVVARERN
jgi:putative component of toxin-antitoxin plasmid stabilization module